jgi:H+/Cl- antiporter ClcA
MKPCICPSMLHIPTPPQACNLASSSSAYGKCLGTIPSIVSLVLNPNYVQASSSFAHGGSLSTVSSTTNFNLTLFQLVLNLHVQHLIPFVLLPCSTLVCIVRKGVMTPCLSYWAHTNRPFSQKKSLNHGFSNF